MVELYIDDQLVECSSEPTVSLSYDAKVMQSVDLAREATTVEVEFCAVGDSVTIFSGEGYLHSARFNAEEHTARITSESHTLIEGVATLTGVRHEGDRGEERVFILQIVEAGAQWAVDAYSSTFNTMPIVDEMNLNTNMIKGRWEGDYPVQFFPVYRDNYETEASSVETGVVRRIYSIDRYHPFLNVGDMLRAIADNAGYTIESKIMEMDHFKRLFMSGAYTSQDNSVAKDVMDFCVKKTTDESTTASSIGVVAVTPWVSANSVSSLVDYSSIDELSECYSRGAYLALDEDGVVTFTPPSMLDVGFEYRIKYTTGYWIESRTRLKALDTFYFGDNDPVQIDVLNLFTDQRGEALYSSMIYRLIVFNHGTESGYRLRDVTNDTVITTWSGRTTTFTTGSSASYGELSLEVLSGSTYSTYEDDWAIYQGYVEERGETEIDVSIRVAPVTLSPTSPKSFDQIFISGAESGTAFTLLEGTTITPYFSSYPGSGSDIEFADLAQHDMSQGDFIEGICHLFNLRLFSHKASKRLFIDPVDEIYDTATVWDWSDKIIDTEPILFEDVAKGVDRTRIWKYQDADGVTNRFKYRYYTQSETYPFPPEEFPEQSDAEALSPEYGAWQRSIANYVADDAAENVLNPIFSPTQNTTDDLPIVGDRDDAELADTLEFSPRVVRYVGMQTLQNESMPYTAFHSVSAGETLCFEDRDSIVGLNQYYRDQIAREERGEYVTLSLRLSNYEMTSLLAHTDEQPHLLSRFGLWIGGEWAECWIESIEEYSAGDSVARIKMLVVG